jgi:hypothetical protein
MVNYSEVALRKNARAASSQGVSAWAPDNVGAPLAAPILVFAQNFVEFFNSFSLLVYVTPKILFWIY